MNPFINEWVHFSECSMPITLNPPEDIKHTRAAGRQRRCSGNTERLGVLHHHDDRGIEHAGDNRIARRAGADDPRAQRDGVGDARICA